MASKKDKGEPVGWVTVKGKHFPKWADGTIGWQDGEETIPSKTNDNSDFPNKSKNFAEAKERNQPRIEKSIEYGLEDGTISKSVAKEAKRIDWGDINHEDVDMMFDEYGNSQSIKGMKWTDIKQVSYMDDKVARKHGYDGGYNFTMNDGSTRHFGWNYGDDMKEIKTGSRNAKKATMELGNGLRLTADVSNPNKNISEVERAKKVNREKQYADKKLNQYRKTAKEEKEKAQSIADVISAKTGIANTGSRNARYDTSRSAKSTEPQYLDNGVPIKEQAYLNYKAIRISKYMPKEEQERLRKLKEAYRKDWQGK